MTALAVAAVALAAVLVLVLRFRADLAEVVPSASWPCRSAARRAGWADACLRYGQVSELRRKTVLGQTSARALQIAVLEAIRDEEAVARVRARVQRGVRPQTGAAPML